MLFQSRTLAFLLLAPIDFGICAHLALSQNGARAGQTAQVKVLVRDGRDTPISHLTADDFIVTEDGVRDRITDIESFHGSGNQEQTASSLSIVRADTQRTSSYVLLIITPMSATGRGHALKDLARILSQPCAENLQIALLDDVGSYVPFGQDAKQLRAILAKLTSHVSALQYIGGSWIQKANRAIQELGIMPGRHSIVVVSDYESKLSESIAQNPWLLRVGPSVFIDSALRAQAGLYTIQSSGPATAVPFGSAGTTSHSVVSGEQAATELMNETVNLGNLRSDILYAADETGGLPASDLKDAFDKIARDAAGSYLLTFEPRISEADGSWRSISVSTRMPNLRVKSPRFYLSPFEATDRQIPDSMKSALESGEALSGLTVSAHAWLFPDGVGAHTVVFAAELAWAASAPPGPGSRLRLFAELINESTNTEVGSWFEERDWPTGENQPSHIHWQREAQIYPGAYTLKVVGMDAASGITGTSAFAFLAHPMGGAALRFSAVVLSDDCLSVNEQAARRRNLFDPLSWEGCELAPTASAHFKSNQILTVLVRLYPPDEQFSRLILKQWSAYAIVDGTAGQRESSPLQIKSAEIRGLVASGKVILNSLNLTPGLHRLTVVFEFPVDNRAKHQIPLSAEFTLDH